ncbi:MAG TPA: NHL repeat-containing protein [Candidatus Binataceae bacterium]|nr:NHL repeat-containing protein [Candidatus Binataceae bacterium]
MGYTPLSSPTVLYLLALGGNAGAGNNVAIGLMGVAGLSNALPASVTINELTTVAAQQALAQFIDSTGQTIGAPSSNATGLANAINQVQANLANISTGLPASFLSCTSGSNCDGLERLDTIANILAACVESSGPDATLPSCAAASTPCDVLFACSSTPSSGTALEAAHVMATSPTANVNTLFALQSGSSPFTPALSAAPDGWEIALNFAPSGLSDPQGVAIDAAGNVWVTNLGGNSVTELTSSGGLAGNFNNSNTPGANFNAPYGVAIDAAGNVWVTNRNGNSVTELTSSGTLAGNFAPSGASFNVPQGVAIDAAGNVWVTNYNGNSVTELTSSGGLAGNFAPSGANFNDPHGVAIDAAGNVWVTNQGGNSVIALTPPAGLGPILSFGNNGFNITFFSGPLGVAIDAAGDAWVTNGGSVIEIPYPGNVFPLNFAPSGANFNAPYGVAIDAAGNVWVTNYNGNSVTELTSSGTLAGNFAPSGASFNVPQGVAIDAAGNVWVTNYNGNSVTELIGAARLVLTPLVACLTQSPPAAVCLP